jgi:hypothetical protein
MASHQWLVTAGRNACHLPDRDLLPQDRSRLQQDHFRIAGFAAGSGASGAIENVAQVLQPLGRFSVGVAARLPNAPGSQKLRPPASAHACDAAVQCRPRAEGAARSSSKPLDQVGHAPTCDSRNQKKNGDRGQ